MSTNRRIQQLETCNREMFGDLVLSTISTTPSVGSTDNKNVITLRRSKSANCDDNNFARCEDHDKWLREKEKRRASDLVERLLVDIYSSGEIHGYDYNSSGSCGRGSFRRSFLMVHHNDLQGKSVQELTTLLSCLQHHVERAGDVLLRQLKRRDALRRQQDAHSDVITGLLYKRGGSESMRFSISTEPSGGESGFSQWAAAMKMVAQLSEGIPPEFRRQLWQTLAERYIASKGVDWAEIERNCFSEWSHPTDAELGVQIVKDLHRTGCSLFCGEDGQENQALLKRVLLAYARWNKAVGYCQGFNMLAALILQVTDKCETDALKIMIYLIEGVLPDSYFADSLRGLSVDMAVFRELLRTRLPRLSRHLDALQCAAKDGTTTYEPPLTNVFTMQWFLTLFCNCLPQPTVLRVWDLILLEGNEVLLRTALAIWTTLSNRIMAVRSADEFYCIMGVLTRELLESNLIDANSLIKAVVTIGPLTELKSLREHYLYNINPWSGAMPSDPRRGVNSDKRLKVYPKFNNSNNNNNKERLVLDINVLKKQYSKLKQRQRQAHIIFSAAISRQPPTSAPVAMNHLLLGKSALVPTKRIAPPPRLVSLPPPPTPTAQIQSHPKVQSTSTLMWRDTSCKSPDSSSSSDTELCDEPSSSSSSDDEEKELKQSEDDNSTSQFVAVNDNLVTITDNIDVDVVKPRDPCSSSNLVPDIGELEDDEEDCVDFETFLQDRLRCLKDNDDPSGDASSIRINKDEEVASERIKDGRRNSEKALQIIQENSLILHRIMQCQSRLSPSPPPPTIIEADNETDYCSGETLISLVEAPCHNFSEQYNEPVEASPWIDVDKNDVTSPEYGSKYTSILEKSKSLDEKYNSLILNSVLPTRIESQECHNSTINSDIYTSTNQLPMADFKLIEFDESDFMGEALISENVQSPSTSSPKSPPKDLKLGTLSKSPSPKSPNKIFNPFPIPMNPRQNKEVPLKLGLYKK